MTTADYPSLDTLLTTAEPVDAEPFDLGALSAAREVPHGRGGYTNHDCRCGICCDANTAAQREYRGRVGAARRADPRTPHGSASTYTNYGCRCADCRAAKAAAKRQYRESR